MPEPQLGGQSSMRQVPDAEELGERLDHRDEARRLAVHFLQQPQLCRQDPLQQVPARQASVGGDAQRMSLRVCMRDSKRDWACPSERMCRRPSKYP